MTREILYPLWDSGLKVGHASRDFKEATTEAAKDIRNKNSMLDARFICGNRKISNVFINKFLKYCRKNEPEKYLRELLSHQKDRRAEKQNTVYLQAPDVKSGVGGLRDYQGVLWMIKVKFGDRGLEELIQRKYITIQEANSYSEAYSFLLQVRNELHFLSKRPVDLLHLEKQPEVAAGLSYKEKDIFRRVEIFMSDYYSNARTISQITGILEDRMVFSSTGSTSKLSFRKVLSAYRSAPVQHVDGFELLNEQLSATNLQVFDEDPERILAPFQTFAETICKIVTCLAIPCSQPTLLIDSSMIKSPSANVTFRSILQEIGNVSPTLCEMHDLGVLARFIPEFGRLNCKVQHDLYHRFTADIHVLHCITVLDEVFQGKRSDAKQYLNEIRKNEVPGLLYSILFLHDLGKDEGPKGHCERGVEIAIPLLKD